MKTLIKHYEQISSKVKMTQTHAVDVLSLCIILLLPNVTVQLSPETTHCTTHCQL